MDANTRQLRRSGIQDPEQQVRWLRTLMRSRQLSESIKKMLCALGYEPMVLALDLPGKTSSTQKSFMKPHTFCNYRGGRWLLGIDYMKVAKYMSKMYWSRIMCHDVLEEMTGKITMDLIRHRTAIARQEEDNAIVLIDGQHRLAALRDQNYKMPFYSILAQQIRKEEVRHALIKALLTRLA